MSCSLDHDLQSQTGSHTIRSRIKARRPHPLSSPVHDRKFDEAIAGATAAYNDGDYDHAISLNTEALARRPSNDLASLLLSRRGDCYLKKGEPDEALTDYEESARLEPNPHTTMSRALALRRKGKAVEARQIFDEAITKAPADPLGYYYRAQASAEDGDFDHALGDYQKALELDPRHTSPRLRCAAIYLRRKETKKALEECETVVRAAPYWPSAYIMRANAYAQAGLPKRALADLDRVKFRKLGNFPDTLNDLAWCRATCSLGDLRNGEMAIEEAKLACDMSKWRRSGYIDTLAAAYAEAGDFANAVKYEQQAIARGDRHGTPLSEMQQRLELYKKRKPYREDLK